MGYDEELFKEFHYVFSKSLGLGVALHALGGILAGIRKPEFEKPQSRWESNQGAFLAAFNIDHFMGIDEFETTMDHFISQARRMKPLPNMPTAELPGGMEWRWEHENSKSGIPIDMDHQKALEDIAKELKVPSVFGFFEETRF
jgi:LDH2 family malate/lactate/ureidoglycolate dehydrogenase